MVVRRLFYHCAVTCPGQSVRSVHRCLIFLNKAKAYLSVAPTVNNGQGFAKLRYQNITFFYITYEKANKLVCYITIGWKGLPGTNALAYFLFISSEENEVLRIRQEGRKWQTH
jgi:hypothetical protein